MSKGIDGNYIALDEGIVRDGPDDDCDCPYADSWLTYCRRKPWHEHGLRWPWRLAYRLQDWLKGLS